MLRNLLFAANHLPKYNYYLQAPPKNTQEPLKEQIAKSVTNIINTLFFQTFNQTDRYP